MRNRAIILILFAALAAAALLAACAPQPTALPATSPAAATPVETEPPSPLPPTSTIAESTNPPPEVLAGSVTPTATPAAPSPTPTLDLSAYQRNARQSVSPDGRIAARVVAAYPQLPDGTLVGDKYHVQVSLVDLQDGSQQAVLDEWRDWGLGYTTPRVLGWTANSGALYLAESGVPDGCGAPFYENVRRVAVGSGEETPVDLDFGEAEFGRGLSLSPDGSQLASMGEGELWVHDLEMGGHTSISFEAPSTEYWPGGTAWSPDGQRLLFAITLNPCSPDGTQTGSLYLADLAGGRAKVLLRADPRWLVPVSWPQEDLAQLYDSDGQDYFLRVSSGRVRAVPPAEIASARRALEGFFSALHEGRYEEAAGLYGGSYEDLQANNPAVDPNDQAALLENACTLNGFQCLPVRRAILIDQPAEGEYSFLVVFDQDGQDFVLGPCCGADIAEMPPMSEFRYTVKQDESGAYRVRELPVYVP